MDVDIKFCQSAFKHGINEADIRWAIDTAKYDGCLEDDDEDQYGSSVSCNEMPEFL